MESKPIKRLENRGLYLNITIGFRSPLGGGISAVFGIIALAYIGPPLWNTACKDGGSYVADLPPAWSNHCRSRTDLLVLSPKLENRRPDLGLQPDPWRQIEVIIPRSGRAHADLVLQKGNRSITEPERKPRHQQEQVTKLCFQILINPPQGKTRLFWVQEGDTSMHLKQQIRAEMGFQVQAHHLVSGAELLSDYLLARAMGKTSLMRIGRLPPLELPSATQKRRSDARFLQILLGSLALPSLCIRKLFQEEYADRITNRGFLSVSPPKPLRLVQAAQICRGQRYSEPSSLLQIQIKLTTGKTLLQWVSLTDLVQDLKQALKTKLGLPSEAQRLIYEGKQLEDFYPLSFYSIKRDATIILTLRLRGGAAGNTSSAKAFSYKDAVHAQKPEKTAPPIQAPKPFLVDKLEEAPSIEIKHPSLDEVAETYAEHAIICRFNGLWPRTADLYQWLHSNWTNNCKVLLCSKGFFIVLFAFDEDYNKALTEGPWFWGSAGLFLTPWFPDFDPTTAVITKLPIWVRLPNLPAHLWHFAVFQGIGNALGRYLDTDISRGEKGIYTFARICVEIDMSKGLPDHINLKTGDFHWTQVLDYENTAFRCRNCHNTGHLQSSCLAAPVHKKKANPKQKSKSWKPHTPPPMDDYDSSSEDEEENAEDLDAKLAQDPPTADHMDLSIQPILQKRNHESSPSDSDKETSPSAQPSLHIGPAQPASLEWVKVVNKKGKKCRLDDSTHAG